MKWLEENPGVKLPRSIKQAAAVTGCTIDAIKTYLYRQRRDIRKELNKIPDLRYVFARFTDSKGRVVETFQADKITYQIDHYSLRLHMCVFREGIMYKIHIFDLKEFMKMLNNFDTFEVTFPIGSK